MNRANPTWRFPAAEGHRLWRMGLKKSAGQMYWQTIGNDGTQSYGATVPQSTMPAGPQGKLLETIGRKA